MVETLLKKTIDLLFHAFVFSPHCNASTRHITAPATNVAPMKSNCMSQDILRQALGNSRDKDTANRKIDEETQHN
jgi:hypothetical protein